MLRLRKVRLSLLFVLFVISVGLLLIQTSFLGVIPAVIQTNHVNVTSPENRHSKFTLPMIYAITPTVARVGQKADLTRLSHTLRLVPGLHWILVEDRDKPSELVTHFLSRCKVSYTHLATKTSTYESVKLKFKEKLPSRWVRPKGAEQRNLGLDWISQNAEYPSVFYFCDDDNTYDTQLFEEMRYTKRVSVWPIGLIAGAEYESPMVKNGKVIGWAAVSAHERKFAIDMAGFAINTDALVRRNPPRFKLEGGLGSLETEFLSQVVDNLDDLEPKADNCSKVLVWHTQTVRSALQNSAKLNNVLAVYKVKKKMEV